MTAKKLTAGLAHYHTAADFMSSADLIIANVYAQKGDAPRSLVNLTFLALEVSIKALLANNQVEFKKVHEIRVLHDALAKCTDGPRILAKIGRAYEEIMRGLAGRVPEYNSDFGTLASVVNYLNKETFIQWRYIFEAIEDDVLTGKVDAVRFPYLNLFLLAWAFLREAEQTVGVKHMPRAVSYQRMPFSFAVRADASSASGIRWEAYVDAFMMGSLG